MNINKVILKIILLSKYSFELTLVYIDKRLLSQSKGDFVYFNDNSFNFLIYSSKTIKIGDKSLRLPCQENYRSGMKKIANFKTEDKMYIWLKRLHNILNECNDNYTPFKNDINYNLRLKKTNLNGDYWII